MAPKDPLERGITQVCVYMYIRAIVTIYYNIINDKRDNIISIYIYVIDNVSTTLHIM